MSEMGTPIQVVRPRPTGPAVTILIMSVPSVARPPAVLVPGGSLLTALAFGVLNALGSAAGGVLALLVGAGVLGEVIVWAGFAGIWSRSRYRARQPSPRGETFRGRSSAMAALVPAALTAALCAGCIALLILLLVVGFAVNAGSGTDVVNDTALSDLLVLLLCVGVALVPGTVQAAVLGAVTALLVRRAYLDPERRALLAAREAARTHEQVAAEQATTPPGRGWRRLGRYVGVSAGILGLVLLVSGRPALGALLLVTAIGTLLVRVWRGVRSPQMAAVRSQLRQRAGLPPGRDDTELVAFRTAEMRETAARLGWAPVTAAGSGFDHLVEQLTARRSNVFRGSQDGTAFVVWDRIDVVRSSTRPGTRKTSRTQISGASTAVEIDFPLVVRLAVVEDRPTAPLAWSHIGPRIDLESGDFNDRFNVYCDDPVRARMVLNPAVMSLLLAIQEPTELLLDRDRLTLTALEALIAPDQIDEQVRLAARIRDSGRSAMARLA
jgi:hypothetical protein